MTGLLRLYHTLRPLRWHQWWYRAWHPLAKRLARTIEPALEPTLQAHQPPHLLSCWPVPRSFEPEGKSFVFLNRRHHFDNGIDWFFEAEGLLWQFNLQYFEWLYDERLSVTARLETVLDFCRNTRPGRRMHAYPASLRIMAWIWLSLKHGIRDPVMMRRLMQDADWLRRFPEYELDGNHLFENAIALCTAGAFLDDELILRNGERIMSTVLDSQLCRDGGHCECSPMYHSLLLWRLLQCLEVLRFKGASANLPASLETAASGMLGWLKAVTFGDGTWPAVNDAVAGIAPEPEVLFGAAARLGIGFVEARLSDSGYRMIRKASFELFVDVGGIKPSWQPGHAHADTGNFCLQVRGKPVFVDTGCSTYAEPGIRRYQRGTAAHNTLVPGDADSSEMWSRFRVGRRCRVLAVSEAPGRIGVDYVTWNGVRLRREFFWTNDAVEIRDFFPRDLAGVRVALHVHPDRHCHGGHIDDLVTLESEGIERTEAVETGYADGFNILLPAACFLHHANKGIGQTCIRLRI